MCDQLLGGGTRYLAAPLPELGVTTGPVQNSKVETQAFLPLQYSNQSYLCISSRAYVRLIA